MEIIFKKEAQNMGPYGELHIEATSEHLRIFILSRDGRNSETFNLPHVDARRMVEVLNTIYKPQT